MSNLSNQVYIYSLSTDAFMNEEERRIKKLKDRFHDKKRLSKEEDNIKRKLSKLQVELSESKKKKDKEILNQKISTTQRQLDYLNWLIGEVFENKKVSNASLKRELKSKIGENNDIRILNTLRLSPSVTISLFESTLTRQLKMEVNKLSDKLIVVEVFNYGIFASLLDKGFYYLDKKYIYLASSSGQIRDKKAVFIQEDVWDDEKGGIEYSITAGLSIVDINNNGGMSVNKFIAYKALASSASEKWNDFDIDKCIVVDDVKVKLENRTVDYVSRDTFNVERKPMDIVLEITDGAGMYLPSVSEKLFGKGVYKNVQFRAPWMKGCLSPVPFLDFTDNPIVTDIYGKEWNIKEAGIEIIFFKSQFKMWKHFIDKDNPKDSWKKYQDNFNKYNCEAAFMNAEEDSIPNAKTNYQYLQSLVQIDNKDLLELARMTNDDIRNMASDVDTMIRVLGCEDENKDKNEFQEAINLYPALLNDENSKMAIKNRKKKMLIEAKAGKLSIDGKYSYVLPDWYAVMENIFNDIGNPKGLLTKDQVYCNLYDEGKVDLLRSPSLSFEHVIRHNTKSEQMEKWFITKGVYISADDNGLPKILQADFDGDKLLITPSETIIQAAEKNAKLLDVVPLEYEMGVSEPKLINSKNIFDSLTVAFKANIGIISNTISKVINKDDFGADDYEFVKKMCSYNNHVIDMAKTLDVVKLPDNIKGLWNEYNRQKLPFFFTHAKNKSEEKVVEKNNSTVNRLADVIFDKRLTFKSVVGKFDYKKLMWTPNIKDEAYIIDEETDKEIIKVYTYLDQNKRHYLPSDEEEFDDKKQYIYIVIRQKLLEIYPDVHKVSDVLVRYLFKVKNSEYKSTLWQSFGAEIVDSIRKNVHKEIDCVCCGVTINYPKQRQVRCDNCQETYTKRQDKERKRKERKRIKEMSV